MARVKLIIGCAKLAVPVPDPAVCAVNVLPMLYVCPTVPATEFQSVLPKSVITYSLPTMKVPATVPGVSSGSIKLTTQILLRTLASVSAAKITLCGG